MRKVLIVFLGAIVALSTMAVSKVNSPETGELVKNEKVVTYKLEKFKSACCIGIVQYSLKEVKGYIKSEANVSQNEIKIWYDANQCTEQDLITALNRTPYKVLKSVN